MDGEGMLITIEGIDGAGKTTQAQMLCDALTAAGESAVFSHEPTAGQWGQRLRDSAETGRLSPQDELHYFIEDRKEHVAELILPAIAAGKFVVLDRYYHSTVAYQGPRGHDVQELARSQQELFPRPSITFLLDLPPIAALQRIRGSRGEVPNQFERESTLAEVRDVFLSVTTDDPAVVKLDATVTTAQLHATIIGELTKLVPRLRDKLKPVNVAS